MGTPQSTSPAPAPQPSWPPTGRGCSRIFQYENPPTTRLLTSFLPRFPPGATPQDRTRVLIINVTPPPAVTAGAPCSPAASTLSPARGGAPPKSMSGRGVCDPSQNSPSRV